MQKMRVLLIGGGGREHAIAWKLKQSPLLEKLYIAPGNAGTELLGENVPIQATEINELVSFAQKHKIDFVFVGPDDPLSMGIVDEFQRVNIPVFGPTKKASQLEWSKSFAKDFMRRNNIPTANYAVFSDLESAVSYVDKQSFPLVIKANGLALGKGVTIVHSREEAHSTLRRLLLDKIFGEAGSEVVVEEFLEGVEISVHVFSDGTTCRIFPTSQDHKRARDNDEGPNTGGMGVVAPLPFVSMEMLAQIDREIVTPTISAMKSEGTPFVGILYPGIMLTKNGPKVFEFNARFGDPETQVYVRLLESDLLEIVLACVNGNLSSVPIKWRKQSACNVVLAAGGYPGSYEKGELVRGLIEANDIPGIVVFHAGTKISGGAVVTNGGRVLGVSALADTLPQALRLAYEAVDKIGFSGKQYRRDIGKKALIIPGII